jgi:hypothetical protein
MGIVVSGYGFSATVMNPIQLIITNPNNTSPVKVEGGGDDRYFLDEKVLDRVPTLLYDLSIIYACVLVCYICAVLLDQILMIDARLPKLNR